MDINSKGRILIVEDNENMRETLRIFFSKLGYDVRVADGGDKTFEILADKPSWHLVITDLVMPEMDGWQVLAAMQEDKALRDIAVVMVSAQDPGDHPAVSRMLGYTMGEGLSPRRFLECASIFSALMLQPD